MGRRGGGASRRCDGTRTALDALRASPDGPAAPQSSRVVGGDPELTLFDVKATLIAPRETI
ncbi:hypothetical protein GCM10010276_06930 [Streptomyces longisporus]|uniref:Uncharacterized protein n=1 Tax=Streptomyces longisporus TaxID=1948 RepID=A0ABN3L0X6_STRLO